MTLPGDGTSTTLTAWDADDMTCTDDFADAFTAPDCSGEGCAMAITGWSAPGACNGDGTYDVDVTVTYTGAGTNGFVLNGQLFAYTSSPQTVTVTLPGDGSSTTLTAWDADDMTCTDDFADAFTSPDCSGEGCAMAITGWSAPGACNGDGTYDVDVTVTYTGAGTNGFILNGQLFAYTSSPQTVTVTLPGDGTSTTLTAWDADDMTCTDSFADAYTAPDCSSEGCSMAITGWSAPGVCNGDGTYDVDVTVTYTGSGTNGFILNGQLFAYTSSPQTVTITLPGDGALATLTVWDADDMTCTDSFADAYTAPDCSSEGCAMAITGWSAPGPCNGDGTYDLDVTITYTGSGTNGFVLNGQSFAYTSSPQTVTITLPGDGSVTTLKAWDVDDPSCSDDFADAFAAPTCTGACAIAITDIDLGNMSTCDPGTNTYTVPVTVTFANPAGSNFTINGNTFAYATSPQVVVLTLPADGNIVNLSIADDVDGGCSNLWANAFTAPASCQISVQLGIRVFLQGAYDDASDLMRDDLRAAGIIPVNEPYTAMAEFMHVGGGGEMAVPGVFDVPVNPEDAIVDWVFLELRDATDNTNVIATRAAFVQRDGDVVDVDGVSPVEFDVAPDDYFVVVRHRNHLGVMTATALPLAGTGSMVDFTDASTPTFGMYAQKEVETGVTALWAGNADSNDQIVFVGSGTENIVLSTTVLLDPANDGVFSTSHTVDGYYNADIDMNGTVVYVGSGTDQILISSNVLLHPGNTSFSQSQPILEQLP